MGDATVYVAPRVRRTFGFATHARQMLTVARESFQEIVMSWGGLVLAGTGISSAAATGSGAVAVAQILAGTAIGPQEQAGAGTVTRNAVPVSFWQSVQ